ncbi:hypothetical protein [Methanoregula sp.]|uniref:hypothetical protein n=1 Tax=Methanoregula sp. TaxID=2052170 RepID=UPI002D01DCB5|nr:hypothetical protein [Methanoregula sp.]HVP96895.1 hypothetical protein [Methanoregula sp.]
MTDEFWDLMYRVAVGFYYAAIGVLLLLFCGLNVTFGYTGEAAHSILIVFFLGGFFFLALGIFLIIDCGRTGSTGLKQ